MADPPWHDLKSLQFWNDQSNSSPLQYSKSCHNCCLVESGRPSLQIETPSTQGQSFQPIMLSSPTYIHITLGKCHCTICWLLVESVPKSWPLSIVARQKMKENGKMCDGERFRCTQPRAWPTTQQSGMANNNIVKKISDQQVKQIYIEKLEVTRQNERRTCIMEVPSQICLCCWPATQCQSALHWMPCRNSLQSLQKMAHW